jgi:hypothetical protein
MSKSQEGVRKEMAELKQHLDEMKGAYDSSASALSDMKRGLHDYQEKAIAQNKALDQIKKDRQAAETSVRLTHQSYGV